VTSYAAPMCTVCTHYQPTREQLTCTAFPDGIPQAILYSQVDHRKPVSGDHGIQFEQAKDAPDVAELIKGNTAFK
jgi:hypothetical protein